jgi:hypothetical protein
MNTPTTASERVREFVARVAVHFEHLPERDRAELLEDLEAHLLEVAAEGDDDLDAELVSPDAYAAELRHSAGLGEPEARPALRQRIRQFADRAREHPWTHAVQSFVPQLRPAWWVLRAWVLVTIVAMTASGADWWRHVPVPGRNPIGLAVLVAAVVVSVRIGLAGRDRASVARAADALLGAATVVLALALLSTSPVRHIEVVSDGGSFPPVLRHADGEPITNLYLYDLEGNELEDVLVFDGAGRPVEIGSLGDAGFPIESVVPRDLGGNPIANLYPLRQYAVDYDLDGELTRTPREHPAIDLPRYGEPVEPSPEPSRSAQPERGFRPARGRQRRRP